MARKDKEMAFQKNDFNLREAEAAGAAEAERNWLIYKQERTAEKLRRLVTSRHNFKPLVCGNGLYM